MKNLKRALSFALATVMLIGMMVVGVSAASFGDADEIVNTDAVNTMVALGIIKGKDDGNFDPEGIVTRAEMAKMICVALNGGKDPNLAGGGLYADTKGHWAAGYIDYCTNMGIVSGDTAGNFNPDKAVTGTEAAKMMLIALGYNAKTEKFVNDTNWAININVIASTRGLYKNVDSLPDAGLSRDNAAQLIFNGIQAKMVRYDLVGIVDGTGVSQAFEIDKTILSDKFETYDVAPEGVMTSFTYNSTKKEWNYTVNGHVYTSAVDFTDLYGRNVNVIAQDPAKNVKKTVYGIFAQDSEILAEGYAGDIAQPATTATKVKIDGTEYKVNGTAATLPIYLYNTTTAWGYLSNVDALAGAYSFKAIDNNGDDKIDLIVATPFTVAKVTYVGKDSMSMSNSVGSYEYKDINVYEGVAKNDYVVFTAAAYTSVNKAEAVKVEVKSGTITGVKGGEYMLDGAWMTNSSSETINVNDTIDYIAFGSVIYYAKVTAGDTYTKDLAFVYNAVANTGSGWNSTGVAKASLMFTDGTKESVTTDISYTSLIGQLVTYRVNNDDEYVLTAVSGTNKAGYDNYGSTAPAGSGSTIDTVGGYELADDAVVFLYKWKVTSASTANASNDVKLLTGKEAKELAKATYTSGVALASKVNGFTYGKVATLIPASADEAFPGVFTGNNYGYLTADAYRTVEGGKNYLNFTIWTADGELVVKSKTDDEATNFVAGTVVTFDTVDDVTVKNVTIPSITTSYVTGYDGAKKVQINGASTTKITDDTVILYVNSKKTTGVEGAAIEIADEPNGAGNGYVNNVRYITNGAGTEFALIVVDVNNKMEALPTISMASPAAVDITSAFAVSNTVSVSGAVPTVAVPAGKTLVLEGTITSVGILTGTGTVELGDCSINSTVNTAITTKVTGEVRLGASANLTVAAGADYETDAGYVVTDGATLVLGSTNVTNALTDGDFTVLHNGAGTDYILTDAITLGANLTIAANDTLTVETSLNLANKTLTIRNDAVLKNVTATSGGKVIVVAADKAVVTGTNNFFNDKGTSTSDVGEAAASPLAAGTYNWATDIYNAEGNSATGFVKE